VVHNSEVVIVRPSGRSSSSPRMALETLGHRIDLYPGLQPAGQLYGRGEDVAAEGKRDDQNERQALNAGRVLGEHGEPA
jgi:hypothetical protein